MAKFTTRPEILGTFGVVASTHWLATATGMAALEQGGNAFDAAVAAGFALQVVEPHLNGPGGEAPIILHHAKSGATRVICGQGPAPRKATIGKFKELGLDLVPGTGPLAAVVPGAFDAWMQMLRDYGTLKVRDALTPAINFADGGYPVVPNISLTIESVRDLFEREWTTSAAVYLPNGAVPRPGSLFANPALAAAYRRLIAEAEAVGTDRVAQIEAARRAWYDGFVADAIDAFHRKTEAMDTSGRRHKGLIDGDDLAGWRATYEEPATYDFHGLTVCKTGPWGQGPVFLQQLALLKGFDLERMAYDGDAFVHTAVECAKLAFADREAFYGDPNFTDVPLSRLLSDDYNDSRRRLVAETASLELRPGDIAGFGGRVQLRDKTEEFRVVFGGAGEPTTATFEDRITAGKAAFPGDTCHVDVVDAEGNMVSATPSGGWLQSAPTIPELGFCLSSRGQMFWLEEGLPASLAPGKRPRTTLSPSLALKDGRAYMAFGTPGGDQQDQWSLGVFLRHVVFGQNLQESIDAPAFHTEHFPASFYPRSWNPGHLAIEGRFAPAVAQALRDRGHRVVVGEDWSIGRVTAVAKAGRVLKAAANPRFMQGYAIGR